MSTTDFFRLVLKLFALYLLVTTLFSVLPGTMGFVISTGIDWRGILWICFIIILLLSLFTLLAFKSDRIVEKLKLGKGFDNPHIPFDKMDAHTIIKVGCIVIGGLTFLQNLPSLLTHLYIAFRMGASGSLEDFVLGYDAQNNTFELVINILNIAISYLLLTNYAWVSKWLAQKEDTL